MNGTPGRQNSNIVTDGNPEIQRPDQFRLIQNYPNPFNPYTTIQYSIPVVEALSAVEGLINKSRGGQLLNVQLKVYDILRREVATLIYKPQSPGNYKVQFSARGGSAYGGNAGNLASGVYFYSLRAGDSSTGLPAGKAQDMVSQIQRRCYY